jgi:hypothetical protein
MGCLALREALRPPRLNFNAEDAEVFAKVAEE